MKVLFLAKSREDPATRYRVTPIARVVTDRGGQAEMAFEPSLATQLRILFIAHTFDVVFIQRKLFSPWFIKLLRRSARQIVFDHDDAIFLKSSGSPSTTRLGRYRSVAGASDLVLAGNSYLCEMASQYADRIELIPTSIDIARYKPVVKKEGPVTLVWIGSRSTSKYLEQHRSTLEHIGQQFPDIRLRVIGDFDFELEHMKVQVVSWSEATETTELATSHIGIAPMTDDAWTRGKCALKVIQYMAAGLPVVSSKVGANEDILDQGVTGFLVERQEDWVQALGQLIRSEALRRQMGEQARQTAIEHYSINPIADRVVTLLDHLSSP